ncbi:MAG: DUF58 domain-containing protein [Bacteroidia bacterium]|nr:DUF58 domain-containing protein [Bacteroidia bacterium]
MKHLSDIFLSSRFFWLCAGNAILFCISFFVPDLYFPSILCLATLIVLSISDLILLYLLKVPMKAKRIHSDILSLGDDNKVEIEIRNLSSRSLKIDIIDELPEQLQVRDFKLVCSIKAYETKSLKYTIKPTTRGEYLFGHINLLLHGSLGLSMRRVRVPAHIGVKVYPSILSMKKYELYTLSKIARFHGIKKMRRIGLSYEFEQIKSYAQGDDTRQINWKTTGKRQQLMINQFEDEKSQPIYSIIDKSRSMLMPFEGMSLMDYAINSTLTLSNVALKKQDYAGLITFSDKIGSVVKADRRHGQLQGILEALYAQKERNLEANYELLYYGIRNMIKTRSLIFLYTNFESLYGLQRALPILRKINQNHLLIVIFFENSELETMKNREAKDLKGVYTHILAEQSINDKHQIAQELNNIGIQCLLTKPEDLTLHTINKYLEMKSRGMI